MTIPSAAVDIVKRWESCRLDAYRDSGSVPTVGYGHTAGVHMGLHITQQQADQWLEHDLAMFARGVRAMVKVTLTDNQFAALLSLTFNIGLAALSRSTLLRRLNMGDYIGARDEFQRWIFDEGKRVEGLVNRRKDEAELWSA